MALQRLAHTQSFGQADLHDVLDKFNLYAFVNEFRKEHGFAKHKQNGQYRHPTLQQYVRSKDRHEVELIKKTCQCPHVYHTNTFSAYQPSNPGPICLLLKPLHSTGNGVNSSIRLKARNLVSRQNKTLR